LGDQKFNWISFNSFTNRPNNCCKIPYISHVKLVKQLPLKITDSVQHAMLQFASQQSDVLEVINDNGGTAGIFSINDLNAAIQQGNINDTIANLMGKSSFSNRNEHENTSTKEHYISLISSDAFTGIINSLYDGIYIADGDGITVKINKAYERITGIKAEQVTGVHMEKLVKAGYISKSVSTQVIKEKRPITMMQTLHNGRRVIVSGTPIYGDREQILFVINNVRDITELIKLKHEIEDLQEIKELRQSSKDMNTIRQDLDLIVKTEETLPVYELADSVAKTDVKVLLLGETGVGKTLVANYIHKKSLRSQASFIELNCGAFPPSLIEAELFGYEAGAFTGASAKGKKGLLEIAHEGTLFLDEIGDLPLELQVKLLKVIDEQKFIPVGSTKTKKVDVRFIAATHQDLEQMVAEGTFREDLYYRLSVVPIIIPPLRERKKELFSLFDHYLHMFNSKYCKSRRLSIEALDALADYHWPGNIRQLMNMIERVVVTTTKEEITLRELPKEFLIRDHSSHKRDFYDLPLKTAVDQLEREVIKRALQTHKTTRKAALALQVSQATIVQKMKKWNITD
jgi:PAS domain S-box-containing protein